MFYGEPLQAGGPHEADCVTVFIDVSCILRRRNRAAVREIKDSVPDSARSFDDRLRTPRRLLQSASRACYTNRTTYRGSNVRNNRIGTRLSQRTLVSASV